MDIHLAEYKASYPSVKAMPQMDELEFAFIGRSNVGKSSLINMLTGRKELAHTSGKPGKTMMINCYLIDEQWYLVDLPGFGYAKRSKKTRSKFSKMIQEYLKFRTTLVCTFLLIDASIPPQQIDIDFINWLGQQGISFHLVFTKIDKKSKKPFKENIQAMQDALLKNWEELPRHFETSALKRTGKDELTDYLQEVYSKINNQRG